MTSLPSSVSSPPPDLSDTDKLSDIEVEELYFDTRDELRDAARKLWDAASRLDRDTGYRRVTDIIAPTPALPPRQQIRTWNLLIVDFIAKKHPQIQSEYANINGFILPSHSSTYSRVTAQSTHMPGQQRAHNLLRLFNTITGARWLPQYALNKLSNDLPTTKIDFSCSVCIL